MSGKRSAASDLNHDNWDREEEPEEAGTFAQASQDQLKGRVIKKAKRRVNANADGAAPGIFAGFGGFGSAGSNAGTAAPAANGMFDFLQKPASTTTTATVAASSNPVFGGAPPSNGDNKPLGAFNFAGLPQKTNGASPKWTCDSCMVSNDSDKNACVCCETKRPGAAPNVQKVEATPTAASAKWTCDSCLVPNDASKDACVCCESARPGAVSKSAFSRAGAAVSSSAFSIQPGGGFKFGSTANSSGVTLGDKTGPGSGGTSGGFSFGTQAMSNANTPSGGGFKFGTAAPVAAAAPLGDFKFGSSSAKEEKSNSFKFGAADPPKKSNNDDGEDESSASSADSDKIGANTDPKPASAFGGFSFGSSNKSGASDGTLFGKAKPSSPARSEQTKSGLESSNSNTQDDDIDYPDEYYAKLKTLNQQVSDWIKQHVDKNPLIILSPIFSDYERHLERLSSEFKMSSAKAAVSPAVTFGTKTNASDKPLLGAVFGEKKATVETFKTTSSPSGAFTFGGSSTTSTSAASFSFATPAAESKGLFSFGSHNTTDAKPGSFSFGETAKIGGAPPAPFSFGNASSTGTSGFSFGSSGSSFAPKRDEEDADEDEPPKVEVNTVVEEDSIHSVRCKLFYKKEKEFKEKGLGMLHLKKVEGSDKTQMVVRAETNLGNILLNILLNEKMMMKQNKNNVQFICIPNPPIKDTEGPVTMLIKVKSAEMAAELVKKVDEVLN